jgi:hypothetical protein
MAIAVSKAAECMAEVDCVMSLLDEHKEQFAFMDKSHTRDAEGNSVVTWTQSEIFLAALRFDSSVQAKRAQAEGVQDLYTIITGKEIDLEYNDVVKRLEDGTTFRITTSGKDNKTPVSASLNMRAVSAKVWVIPDD